MNSVAGNEGCCTIEYRRLRAPRGNGSRLIEPPLGEVAALLNGNEDRRRAASLEICGRPLAELAAEARRELVEAARAYTGRYRDLPPLAETDRVLLAGHQPQLFHPGVWYKNFVLSQLAESHRAVAVNLQVDSDTIKRSSVRVPTGSVEQPAWEDVPFDKPGPEIPFEERPILDRELFGSFPQRVAARIAPFVADPLVHDYWKLATHRAEVESNLGAVLAEARDQLEGQWGLSTLELPQSRVCGLESFHWFTLHNLVELPRLQETYNCAVRQYRQVNHVRSANHPVPELTVNGDWLEAPYWVWTHDKPRRRRLFVRRRGDLLDLTNRDEPLGTIPISRGGDRRGVEALAAMGQYGIKLRTRALLTTLFARLLLGDLFLHGIGGAKYDEVTDLLFRRFYGLDPPGYLVATATIELPIPRQAVREEDARRVRGQLRELEFHPEKHLAVPTADRAVAEELVQKKTDFVRQKPTHAAAQTRCRAIRAANEALQPWVAPRRLVLDQELAQITSQLRSRAILGSREFSFCLYPSGMLRDFLVDIPGSTP